MTNLHPIKTADEHRAALARIDQIMTGSIKRLSIAMIRWLHDQWHIPADALIRDAA